MDPSSSSSTQRKEEDDEEQYALLEMVDRGWMQRLFGEIAKTSTVKQIAIGGFSGWMSGYALGRVGRAAAVVLGGSIILVQVASYKGIIHVNWTEVDDQLARARRTMNDITTRTYPIVADEVVNYARHNGYFASSFLGGFLLGIGL